MSAARRISGRWRRAIIGAASAVIACNVGPRYQTPSAPLAAAYKERPARNDTSGWKVAAPRDRASRGPWWEAYNDPRLDSLIERINVSNQTIAAAVANVQVARAIVREARAQLYPVVTTNPSVTATHLSTAFGRSIGVTFLEYSLPVEATWEPDLWGRVRKTVQADEYAAEAAVADLENVRLSAQASLASNYYGVRAQDELKALLDSSVLVLRQTLDLTRVLYVAGRNNDQAVAQAEVQLKAAEALAANAGILRAQYEHAIAVLIGIPPAAFSLPRGPQRWNPPPIPTTLPSQLLERRPDIASAERSVAQANAQIGVALTAFYPTLTLSASAGFLSTSLSHLLSWPSRVWSVGPSLMQTIFDAGQRRATVDQYRAAYDQTVANYRQTVLTAFQQVEDNLAAVRILDAMVREQDAAIAAAQRGFALSAIRYRAGIDPYLDVLSAAIVYLNQAQTGVSYRMQRMTASLQLIKALGGGWEVPASWRAPDPPASLDRAHIRE